jgi:hypothetical protein
MCDSRCPRAGCADGVRRRGAQTAPGACRSQKEAHHLSRYLLLRYLITQLGCTHGAGRRGDRGDTQESHGRGVPLRYVHSPRRLGSIPCPVTSSCVTSSRSSAVLRRSHGCQRGRPACRSNSKLVAKGQDLPPRQWFVEHVLGAYCRARLGRGSPQPAPAPPAPTGPDE